MPRKFGVLMKTVGTLLKLSATGKIVGGIWMKPLEYCDPPLTGQGQDQSFFVAVCFRFVWDFGDG